MRFDLTDLRLFRHVAETGSITHGAERSHLALASASARIRGMEEMLDVPLLQRGRRGVALTDAGRSLLDHARIVLQQVDSMRGELSAYSRGLKGSVRVLANTAALSEHLPRLLADFLAANPTIDLDLEDRESPAIAAAVAAGDADIQRPQPAQEGTEMRAVQHLPDVGDQGGQDQQRRRFGRRQHDNQQPHGDGGQAEADDALGEAGQDEHQADHDQGRQRHGARLTADRGPTMWRIWSLPSE